MKPKGTLILVSYGLPDKRLPHLKHPDFTWEVRMEKAIKLRQVTAEETEGEGGPEPEYHYIYICAKVGSSKQNEPEEPKYIIEDPNQPPVEEKKGAGAKTGSKPKAGK